MGAGAEVERLEQLLRHLRAVSAWEARQTHRSLAPYLVEETAELLEAIEATEAGASEASEDDLRGELGDLLLQVVFHAAVAADRGAFDLADVARGLREKLERRQPAALDRDAETGGVLDEAEAVAEWERRKALERPRDSVLDGIAPAHLLDPLTRAQKILARSSRADGAPLTSAEVGEQILALVARAEASGVDAGQATRDAVRALEARVRATEAGAGD